MPGGTNLERAPLDCHGHPEGVWEVPRPLALSCLSGVVTDGGDSGGTQWVSCVSHC